MNLKPGLYIVSTPIGNISDISFRAIETLQNSNMIFCEDTRVTAKLLAKYNIKKKLFIYNDQSTLKERLQIAQLIQDGNIISLVSDAGTPLICDPGYKLIEYLKQLNLHIDIAPGPCSIICALTLSGMPTNNFYFGGFIPKSNAQVEKIFDQLKNLESSLVFFDTARNLVKNLEIAYEIYGDREISIVREITKLYQETHNSTILNLIKEYKLKPPKGEIVIIISGSKSEKNNVDNLEEFIKILSKKNLSTKDIVEIILLNYPNYNKKDIYKKTMQIRDVVSK